MSNESHYRTVVYPIFAKFLTLSSALLFNEYHETSSLLLSIILSFQVNVRFKELLTRYTVMFCSIEYKCYTYNLSGNKVNMNDIFKNKKTCVYNMSYEVFYESSLYLLHKYNCNENIFTSGNCINGTNHRCNLFV